MCGIVYVIVRLAVAVEYWLETHRHNYIVYGDQFYKWSPKNQLGIYSELK